MVVPIFMAHLCSSPSCLAAPSLTVPVSTASSLGWGHSGAFLTHAVNGEIHAIIHSEQFLCCSFEGFELEPY